MNVALPKHFEDLIARLVASGRFNDSNEVVRAGLQKLEEDEHAFGSVVYPPGSLLHLYTPEENEFERLTGQGSSLKVESFE